MLGRPFHHYREDGQLLKIIMITDVRPVPGSSQLQIVGPVEGRAVCIGPTTAKLNWQGFFHHCHVSPEELQLGFRDDRAPTDEGWD